MANINFEIFVGNISFIILFFIMILYWVQTIFSIIPKFHFVIFFITLFGNAALFTLLIVRWLNYGHFPLSNLYESLIFLSWSFTLIELFFTPWLFYLNTSNLSVLKYSGDSQFINSTPLLLNNTNFGVDTVKILKYQFKNININTIIGTILSPIALFTNSFATFSLPKNMQKAQALVPALQSNWLMMHVTVMMLSYTALLCGSLLAITFLVITWHHPRTEGTTLDLVSAAKQSNKTLNSNKKKDVLIENQEMSIDVLAKTLDNLSYRILGIGFPLLTIGILSGAVWANEAWGSYWSWDPKETWAFITWLIFAIYLHTRITKGWQGKKPAILASFGFFIVWICYLGVNILGAGLHSYGWLQLHT